eukprot:7806949-Prorocentrum_lima.AAC.1
MLPALHGTLLRLLSSGSRRISPVSRRLREPAATNFHLWWQRSSWRSTLHAQFSDTSPRPT